MNFESLGLKADILRAVEEQGYVEPTPIQQQAIPVVLSGKDLLASAQTGTGKTAGFTLPILQLLSEFPTQGKGRRPVRALILTPTRELAAQVGENVRDYSKHLRLRSFVVFGGVSINPQMMKLRGGVDILVATPGRLLDLEHQNAVDLSHVEILVLDEADRMLDMGFIHDIRRVLNKLPAKRQNLLFSATFSDEIKSLANKLLKEPVSVEVARRNSASEQIEQSVHFVDKKRKGELLSYMIGSQNWQQVLIFTRTKHGANRLAEQLNKDGVTAAAIHGNKSQGARTRALADFKTGNIRALVATDIAARGLDIDQLPHVVNYELPNVAEDYVHRIGRTGRADATGQALSLVCVDEHKLLKDIERLLKREIPRIAIQGYEPDPSIKAEPIQNGRNDRGNPSRGNNHSRDNNKSQSHNSPRDNSSRRNGSGENHSHGNSPWGNSSRDNHSRSEQPRSQCSNGKQGHAKSDHVNQNGDRPRNQGTPSRQRRQRISTKAPRAASSGE
ncbi:ATP-dependent RNA helicase RhlE [Xenorhabdus sp. IM139775]|uniref:ATP-dependent RNA helicase RhlE n=1 Tax=Xenorhabdus sp. IM139775 TaxID=3025876 RepID=UPI002359D6B2|nr:ATP-dependent RNA helicase RhlE [Xenorhabdus sp. IM139775]MDC9592518.1 ATP-dependent RNA helicase RhlE [Xenorhabdus sp. IM139775]